jgi:hypothetical protein
MEYRKWPRRNASVAVAQIGKRREKRRKFVVSG